MKNIIIRFIIGFICITIINCTTTEIKYKYIKPKISCSEVKIPEFPDFDYTKELIDPYNINVLVEQLSLYRQYVDDLKEVIECYKKQTNIPNLEFEEINNKDTI